MIFTRNENAQTYWVNKDKLEELLFKEPKGKVHKSCLLFDARTQWKNIEKHQRFWQWWTKQNNMREWVEKLDGTVREMIEENKEKIWYGGRCSHTSCQLITGTEHLAETSIELMKMVTHIQIKETNKESRLEWIVVLDKEGVNYGMNIIRDQMRHLHGTEGEEVGGAVDNPVSDVCTA